VGLGPKKNRQAFGWRFLGFGGWSLAGPVRQQAGKVKEAEKDAAIRGSAGRHLRIITSLRPQHHLGATE
jgi:hypothetical protein